VAVFLNSPTLPSPPPLDRLLIVAVLCLRRRRAPPASTNRRPPAPSTSTNCRLSYASSPLSPFCAAGRVVVLCRRHPQCAPVRDLFSTSSAPTPASRLHRTSPPLSKSPSPSAHRDDGCGIHRGLLVRAMDARCGDDWRLSQAHLFLRPENLTCAVRRVQHLRDVPSSHNIHRSGDTIPTTTTSPPPLFVPSTCILDLVFFLQGKKRPDVDPGSASLVHRGQVISRSVTLPCNL
jgi:hypothetical protein